MSQQLKQLSERHGDLLAQADKIIKGAITENRDLNSSESEKLGGLKSEIFTTNRAEVEERNRISMMTGTAPGERRTSSGMNLEGYSLTRAIRQASRGQLSGIEAEASQEIAYRSGKETAGGSFFVPNLILAESREMSVTGAAGVFGSNGVQTEIRGFINALRVKLKVAQAGATILDGLTSNIAIPREKAASTAGWHSETASLSEKTPEIEQLLLSPKRVGGFTVLSNQLIGQSSFDCERFVRNDLLSAIATSLDQAAINGSGTSNQPLGILNTPGIASVAGGTNGLALNWSLINALITAVADANGDEGKLAFLTNAAVAGKLRSTPRVVSTDSRFILEGNSLLDLPFYASNNVPRTLTKGTAAGICSAIIHGNFEDVILASFFEGSSIICDPFSLAVTGQTRIVIQSFCDVGVRNPASFAACKDVLTA